MPLFDFSHAEKAGIELAQYYIQLVNQKTELMGPEIISLLDDGITPSALLGGLGQSMA